MYAYKISDGHKDLTITVASGEKDGLGDGREEFSLYITIYCCLILDYIIVSLTHKHLLPSLFSHQVMFDSFATLWTVAPPGSSVHGISPGKNTGVVAVSYSRGSSPPRD